MRLTGFPNLEMLLGETALTPPSSGSIRRMIAGAAIGCVIGLGTLLFFAALVRWMPVLRLWPSATAIGGAFGGIVGLLRKPPAPPDGRFGEHPNTGKIIRL